MLELFLDCDYRVIDRPGNVAAELWSEEKLKGSNII
jgi:hypothetical protein